MIIGDDDKDIIGNRRVIISKCQQIAKTLQFHQVASLLKAGLL